MTTSRTTMGRNAYDDEKVTTWADGFNVWHVRITFPARGYDKRELARHADRLRAKARRTIRGQVAQRERIDPGWVCRIGISDTDTSADGVTKSITFREKL